MLSDLPQATRHLVVSYSEIRRAIGIIGFLLPLLLGPVGWFVFGVEIQDNMSNYYHTPLRDIFVGTLSALGIFLFCYRGYDWVENWTANVGSMAVLAIALFPLDPDSDPMVQSSISGYIHMFGGGLFFLTLSLYSLFYFPNSRKSEFEQQPHEAQRDLVYRLSGLVILLSMSAMGVYLFLLPAEWKLIWNRYNLLFWLEWVALWSFAAAWLTKGQLIFADIAIDLLAITHDRLRALRHRGEHP
ncbi:MAG: DUF998 domain-containing protein [Planctomycetaceae bacterium]|nr:DUF998 domain-containing protein [Planctomycetaceae bacterium]